ncbi:MAG: aspartyl protease family protein [Mucilaginibacter sp.]|nr:aspartyl protease family protein [Mucilaginibacter sp.]
MLAGKATYFGVKALFFTALFLCAFHLANAQYFALNPEKKKVNIPFKMMRNMIIVKMSINNKGPFNFILDTGVGLMIITDYSIADSLALAHKRTIKLNGLGDGDASEAIVTPPLDVQIDGLKSNGISAAILKSDLFDLSGHVGMTIHGLLGYEFFNGLGVNINFNDSLITVYRPKEYKPFRKSQKIPITIEDHKPYLHTYITLPDGTAVLNKFVLDLGAGHPVSLENMIKKYGLPKNAIAANLGVALNGPISGYLSRIKEVELGKYSLKNVITSFPNTDYVSRASVERDGNLGMDILKKFNIGFDYSNGFLYIRPSNTFKAPFEHDMSGIEYYLSGENLSHLIVSRIAPGSPADDVGMLRGDEITSINFKPTSKMNTEEIDNYFKAPGKSLLLEVYHDGRYERVVITLRRQL